MDNDDEDFVPVHKMTTWQWLSEWNAHALDVILQMQDGNVDPEGVRRLQQFTRHISSWCDRGQCFVDPMPLWTLHMQVGYYAGVDFIERPQSLFTRPRKPSLKSVKESFADARLAVQRMLVVAVRETIPDETPDIASDGFALNECEKNVIQTLQENGGKVIGEQIATESGYPFNANFKSTLSRLVLRGQIRNDRDRQGYYL